MIRIVDDAFGSALLAEAAAAWPGPDWNRWHRYDGPFERKRVCRDWQAFPRAVTRLQAALLTVAAREAPGLVPDSSLYGAGMCDMRDGDCLQLHLDHDRHPEMGLGRRLNAILFLGPAWRAEWGGELQLWDRWRSLPAVRVLPVAGRLVLFEPDVPHAVTPVVGPEPRRSLSVYLYGEPWRPPEEALRPRARFVGFAGEAADPAVERLRAERSQSSPSAW